MKKWLAFVLALVLAASAAGCAGRPATVDTVPDRPKEETEKTAVTVTGEGEMRTGLAVTASLGSSASAGEMGDGLAQTDVTIVAVTVDEDGVITGCVIDGMQAKANFDAQGNVVSDLSAPVLSKNELGADYGMEAYSGIGREWNEQAAALAEYVVGKTADEVLGIAVNEETRPAGADLASSVTIAVGGFLPAIAQAVENAQPLGARGGDTLQIVTTGSLSSGEGVEGAAGMLQADISIAAATRNGQGVITSCRIDAVQTQVSYDAAGQLLTDTAAPVLSKDQLGADYGMGAISGIGREWNEQAAAFAAYATGKTVEEVAGIAVDEGTKPTDADLAASVTIAIGGFQALLEKLG